MSIVYNDAFLSKFCTEDRENRAYSYVDDLGTFSTAWRDELAKIRCYILAAMENQAQPDDLFAEKIKTYNAEFNGSLAFARIDEASTAEDPSPGIFSIPIERA